MASGEIARDSKKIKAGELLRIRLAMGETEATATGAH
jgi:hypothetical protein